jgi:hypothetical protein
MVNLIKIDLDVKVSKELLNEWLELRKVMLKHLGLDYEYITCYESNKGYHIYIKLKQDVTPKRIIELQFLLGDDHNRVWCNFQRYEHNDDDVLVDFNILFDTLRKREIDLSQT